MNWYQILLFFSCVAISCTRNAAKQPVYSFVQYADNDSEANKVWTHANCAIPFQWYISTQAGSRSLFFTRPGDNTELLLVDSLICFSPAIPHTKAQKNFVFTEQRAVIDGNHYYYYHDQYGVFMVETVTWYSGMKLVKIDKQYSDSLELVRLAARLGMERLKERKR